MNRYIIYCTEKQTKQAIKLGAPVKYKEVTDFEGHLLDYEIIDIPTAEQMLGWLRTKGFAFNIAEYNDGFDDHIFWRVANSQNKSWYKSGRLSSVKEATLAVIDAALEYLKNPKQ